MAFIEGAIHVKQLVQYFVTISVYRINIGLLNTLIYTPSFFPPYLHGFFSKTQRLRHMIKDTQGGNRRARIKIHAGLNDSMP